MILTVGWTSGGAVLGGWSCFLLMRSPWGRVLKAIREDEDAVRSLGKNVYFYKMQSADSSGACTRLPGGFHLLSGAGVPSSRTYFGHREQTFYVYTVLILGGGGARV